MSRIQKIDHFEKLVNEFFSERKSTIFAKETIHYFDKLAEKFPYQNLVKIGRHCKVMPGGRVFSFSALVTIGNGKGSAGVGYGKALQVSKALENALRDAEKNIISIFRYQNRTILSTIKFKFISTIILLQPLKEGKGLRGK